MARKATHSGECQLCGRKQKLPGGSLSKHGYTKEWGFFQGTCPGSDKQPYELSCDQITARIPAVRDSVAQQEAVIAELETTPLPADKMMVNLFKPSRGRERSGYVWVETQVRGSEYAIEYFIPEGYGWRKTGSWERGEYDYRKGPQTAERVYTAKWIKHLQANLTQTKTYLAWLVERETKWTLKTLTAVLDN